MNYKHGHNKKGQTTPEYRTWCHMLGRCNNPKDKRFKDYGGRGIKVCEAWKDFRAFFADMGPRPSGLTLDRRDNSCGYEPGNCCWATCKEQRLNSRPISCGPFRQRRFYGHGPNGEMIIENSQSCVAKTFELDRSSISHCLNGKYGQHKGWIFQWI